MVLVGSVDDAPEAAVADVDVPDVDDVADDVLAWRSTNNFCRASLTFDPLLLVEFTWPVLLVADVLDDGSPGGGGGGLKEVGLLVPLVLLDVAL